MFQSYREYDVALMRLLDGLAGRQGPTRDVIRAFGVRYRDQIPARDKLKNKSGHIRWEWRVRWSRQILADAGLIDAPEIGLWQLSEQGHRWLRDHLNATRLTDEDLERGKRARKEGATKSRSRRRARWQLHPVFFQVLQIGLEGVMPRDIVSRPPEIETRNNRLQVRLPGFRSCHYEVRLGREHHEISIRFHSTKRHINETRRQAFEPHLNRLSNELGHQLLAEVFGSDQSRTRIWIRLPSSPPTEPLARQYGSLAARFIKETLPILKSIHGGHTNSRKRQTRRIGSTSQQEHHQILDREVEAIRAFLDGRSGQRPSDEKLCDLVQFCYTFGLYDEATRLFALVASDGVNSWYFNRTKRLAAICQVRAQDR